MRLASSLTGEADRGFRFSPASAAFFFDVDGTLLELKERPRDVVADRALLQLLERLRDRAKGAVALVSGRSIADLDRIFAPLVLPAAALHGAEIRYPDGAVRAADPHIMDHARPEVSRFVRLHPDLMLEDKGATLAVHFRGRPDLGPAVLQFLKNVGPSDEIAVQEGKLVAELKSALVDKGSAIASLLARAPFSGRVPVFFGDDLTDESGFATVNAFGGSSFRIGARETPTEAREHVADSAELRRRLSAWLDHAREAS